MESKRRTEEVKGGQLVNGGYQFHSLQSISLSPSLAVHIPLSRPPTHDWSSLAPLFDTCNQLQYITVRSAFPTHPHTCMCASVCTGRVERSWHTLPGGSGCRWGCVWRCQVPSPPSTALTLKISFKWKAEDFYFLSTGRSECIKSERCTREIVPAVSDADLWTEAALIGYLV